mmetsp:Transcript_15052/g.45053  ORF Transcript_15052/g.45053 Transcript_15052/m.45053 type:complete len:214 (-) Transcript_15052:358-999(-)
MEAVSHAAHGLHVRAVRSQNAPVSSQGRLPAAGLAELCGLVQVCGGTPGRALSTAVADGRAVGTVLSIAAKGVSSGHLATLKGHISACEGTTTRITTPSVWAAAMTVSAWRPSVGAAGELVVSVADCALALGASHPLPGGGCLSGRERPLLAGPAARAGTLLAALKLLRPLAVGGIHGHEPPETAGRLLPLALLLVQTGELAQGSGVGRIHLL